MECGAPPRRRVHVCVRVQVRCETCDCAFRIKFAVNRLLVLNIGLVSPKFHFSSYAIEFAGPFLRLVR